MLRYGSASVAQEGHDRLVANFLQSVYTGDAPVGHVSPVGAYDAKRARVLVFDVDRKWYEPYWVPEKAFVEGLATADPVSDPTTTADPVVPTATSGTLVRVGTLAFTGSQLLGAVALALVLFVLGSLALQVSRQRD